jgi:hypothetical protein
MNKKNPIEIKWMPAVEQHDYPAAESYLNLLYNIDKVGKIITKFRSAPIVQFKAKDIFRASRLSVLGVSNSHVEKDRIKIRKGKPLSPLLLLRDKEDSKVVIADGYHRMCAVYEINEDAMIPCKIV